MESSMDTFPLAMAYVPMQRFTSVYELNEALKYGTIFPELNKPFMGSKGGCRC
ncbi:MAG: spore coat associated protein CotJA [Lachnospiraceae bacterium]|nr:spore coat associated protein CotJA [Lachnospiraceae bacterium]